MITQEEKKQIFALYFKQKVGVSSWSLENNPIRVDIDFLDYACYEGNCQYLLLKPLSQISDEDAVEALRIFKIEDARLFPDNCADPSLDEFKEQIEDMPVITSIADYLRSHGYALPYMNWSVSELVEAGVFKLVEP